MAVFFDSLVSFMKYVCLGEYTYDDYVKLPEEPASWVEFRAFLCGFYHRQHGKGLIVWQSLV